MLLTLFSNRSRRSVSVPLPYTLDFTILSNGPLPAPWAKSTWSISGGRAINVPLLGNEALTDPDLEGNYTSGLNDALSKTGSPTVAQSADVHKGSKAQAFTAVAVSNRVFWNLTSSVAHQWRQFSAWVKRTAGTGGTPMIRVFQNPNARSENVYETSYTRYGVIYHSATTAARSCEPVRDVGASGWDALVVDDCSDKPYANGVVDLCSAFKSLAADLVLKVRPDPGYFGAYGVIARANSNNPTSYVALWGYKDASTTVRVVLEQCLAGVFSAALVDTSAASAVNADLELRLSGNTAKAFYNNVQVSTDQTLDASIASNKNVAMFASEGAQLKRFFVSAN